MAELSFAEGNPHDSASSTGERAAVVREGPGFPTRSAGFGSRERPRERLLLAGAGALSDAELLAVLLRTGCSGQTAVDVGRGLLERFGSLRAMFAAAPGELCAIRGLGAAKVAQLAAAVELTRRMLEEQLRLPDTQFGSPGPVRDYLRLSLAGKENEVFVVLLLDSQNRLLRAEELFRGTLTQTSVYPREVVKLALRANAASAIFAHNHPSGVAEPSRADELLTQSLKSALTLVDVRTLDHFIVAGSVIVSMAERGLV